MAMPRHMAGFIVCTPINGIILFKINGKNCIAIVFYAWINSELVTVHNASASSIHIHHALIATYEHSNI